jgi:hypothetical protein
MQTLPLIAFGIVPSARQYFFAMVSSRVLSAAGQESAVHYSQPRRAHVLPLSTVRGIHQAFNAEYFELRLARAIQL